MVLVILRRLLGVVDDENLHAFRLRLQFQSQLLFERRKKRRTGSCRLFCLHQCRWQAGGADARLFFGVRGPVEIEGIVTIEPGFVHNGSSETLQQLRRQLKM